MRCGIHCAPDAHRNALTFPDGAARVSPGYFTDFEEIEEFLKAINLEESGLDQLVREGHALLGLITFLRSSKKTSRSDTR